MLDVKALRAEIARNGLTQGQVAERIGMTATTFSKKMKTNGFGINEADAIIELLGIQNPSAIFFGQQVT